jgi:hypothetical protein
MGFARGDVSETGGKLQEGSPEFSLNKKKNQIIAVVIPSTPAWTITATATMTPAISRATAMLPFMSSSKTCTPFVSFPRIVKREIDGTDSKDNTNDELKKCNSHDEKSITGKNAGIVCFVDPHR